MEAINAIDRAAALLPQAVNPEPPLPVIREGMRVRIDYSHPASHWHEQRHSGREGVVRRENRCGRALPGQPDTAIQGGLWYVLLDATARREAIEICIGGAALVPVEPEPTPESAPTPEAIAEAEPTYEQIVTQGTWLESRNGYDRYMLDTDEPGDGLTYWVSHDEERLCEPGEEDGDSGLDDDEDKEA